MTTPTTDLTAGLQLPSTEAEEWRYSRIGELDLSRFPTLAPRPQGEVPSDLLDRLENAAGVAAATVVVHNGHPTAVDVRHPKLRIEAAGPLPESPAPVDAFGELHERAGSDVVFIDVPDGVMVEEPVIVLNWVDAPGAISLPRLIVRTGESSQVTVVEWQASSDVEALVAPVVELHAGAASNLRYLNAQELGRSVWQVARHWARPGRDATVSLSNAALGGHYARVSIEALLDEKGGTANLTAVYFSDGEQMHDFRSLQDHFAARTTSHLLFKGAVADKAHSVYSGLIRVRAGAKDSDSFLANRNLVLSPTARVDSVPNLEIINENDLRNCGHASATGPIDEEHLFYLESRGVPTDVAERLIILGFFDEVVQRMQVPALRGLLNDAVARNLDAIREG